jgi:hypothetical protein
MSAKKKAPAEKTAANKAATDTEETSEKPVENTRKDTFRAARESNRNSPPERRDVVALATNLVSSQILASSYHDTAMNLLGEVRQLAVDALQSVREIRHTKEFDTVDSLLAVGIDIATKAKLDLRRLRPNKFLDPMSHSDLDRLFQSAMRRAFVMLNASADAERIVFAEQLFSPLEILTEGAIRKRLIDYRWPSLKSGKPVIRLMKNIRRWFLDELERLQAICVEEDKEPPSADDPSIAVHNRIEAEVIRLRWLLDKLGDFDSVSSQTRQQYQSLSSAVSGFISTRNGLDFGGAFRNMAANDRTNIIFLMFDPLEVRESGQLGSSEEEAVTEQPRSTQDVSEDSETDPQASSPGQPTYRPWAIFRYLRRYGRESEDIAAQQMNEKLRAKRSDLNPDLTPDILEILPAALEFGPLHEEFPNMPDQF